MKLRRRRSARRRSNSGAPPDTGAPVQRELRPARNLPRRLESPIISIEGTGPSGIGMPVVLPVVIDGATEETEGMRLLLVEDDELLGNGIQAGLSQAGYAVDWVKDGEAAAASMRTTSTAQPSSIRKCSARAWHGVTTSRRTR